MRAGRPITRRRALALGSGKQPDWLVSLTIRLGMPPSLAIEFTVANLEGSAGAPSNAAPAPAGHLDCSVPSSFPIIERIWTYSRKRRFIGMTCTASVGEYMVALS